MKKVFLILILLMLIVIPLLGQISGGFKAVASDYFWRGADWKDFSDFYNFDNEFVLSISAGAFCEIRLTNRLALQPEVLFTSSNHKYGDGLDWIEETWKLFEILLYGKFINPVAGGRIYILAGPDISLFRKEIEVEYSSGFTGIAIPYNDILLGYAIAMGYEIDTKNGAVLIGLKYSNEITQYSNGVDIYSNGIGLEVGVKFGSPGVGTGNTKSKLR